MTSFRHDLESQSLWFKEKKIWEKCIGNKIDVNVIVKGIIYDHAFLEY